MTAQRAALGAEVEADLRTSRTDVVDTPAGDLDALIDKYSCAGADPLPIEMDSHAEATSEFKRYMAEPLEKKPDIMKWWYDRETKFPIISALAKRYLAVPAATAPSERLFSKAGLLLEKRRARLRPDRARWLMFLHHNLHHMGAFPAATQPASSVAGWLASSAQ